MKNTVYAIIIAVCLLVAVVVFVKTRSGGGSGGIDSISDTEKVLVKCKACNASYEMGRKQYYKEIAEKSTASAATIMLTPPLTCQKCSKNMVFLAEKCPNCGEIFFSGSIPGDSADRCPKCKHSKIEDSRKARLGQQ
jgi:predicted Zn-ribbon and HTH transcriptional regulator